MPIQPMFFKARAGQRLADARLQEKLNKRSTKSPRPHGVRRAAKNKSMVTDAMPLNQAPAAAAVQVTEADPGESILQINNNEAPSHVIAPVMHKDRQGIFRLFEATSPRLQRPGGRRVPGRDAGGWAATRGLLTLTGKTFKELYAERRR